MKKAVHICLAASTLLSVVACESSPPPKAMTQECQALVEHHKRRVKALMGEDLRNADIYLAQSQAIDHNKTLTFDQNVEAQSRLLDQENIADAVREAKRNIQLDEEDAAWKKAGCF